MLEFPTFFAKFGALDRIFGDECKTMEVYCARTKDIVASAVRGFNGMFLFHCYCSHYYLF